MKYRILCSNVPKTLSLHLFVEKEMKITLIAAVALDGAIGRDNALLWHIHDDMVFFRKTTMGHPVIMGRKTWESIGRALPGRLNIVVSRSQLQLPEGVVLAQSLQEALQAASASEECFVMGGGQIYREAMPFADTLLITRVFCTCPDADTVFPPIAADEWDIAQEGETLRDEKTGVEFRFEKYVRIDEEK